MKLPINEYEPVGAVGSECGAVIAGTVEEVYEAHRLGYRAQDIFFLPPAGVPAADVLHMCRPVAASLEQLLEIDCAAAQSGGELVSVGLRLVPNGYHAAGISVSELGEVSKLLPSLPHLTVRGCFVAGDLDGLYGRELGRFFRAAYESAKRMTVTLPCAMPYLCVEGGLAALEQNRLLHPETLEDAITAAQIVAAQNSTAFYARLLIT